MASRKQVEAARVVMSAAQDAVFAFAPTPQTKFSECLAVAPDHVREAYDVAFGALEDAEYSAIKEGRAYRASFGMLTWYRPDGRPLNRRKSSNG